MLLMKTLQGYSHLEKKGLISGEPKTCMETTKQEWRVWNAVAFCPSFRYPFVVWSSIKDNTHIYLSTSEVSDLIHQLPLVLISLLRQLAFHIRMRKPIPKLTTGCVLKYRIKPNKPNIHGHIPSRGLTYPTWGKGKSSSKCHFWGIC